MVLLELELGLRLKNLDFQYVRTTNQNGSTIELIKNQKVSIYEGRDTLF